MKRTILFLTAAISLSLMATSQLMAQVPAAINYQAVARDGNTLITNQTIDVRFTLSEGATALYQETHSLSTNPYGLFTTQIGTGIPGFGTFSGIDWSSGNFTLKVEMDPGTGFLNMGTTEFASVPYSLYADKANMAVDDLTDVNAAAPATGEVLKWNGTAWAPATDDNNPTTYTAGTGISISGTTISNAAPDQTISLTGTGATSVSGTYPNFTINSTDNVNDADANPTNEIQSLSLSGNTLSLSLGGGSASLASFASPWSTSGSNLFYNAGNVGIGDNSPSATLTVGDGDKIQMYGADGDIVLSDDEGSLRFASTSGANAPMIQMFASGTSNSTRMLVAHSPSFPTWGLRYNDTADAFTWIGNNQPVLHTQLGGQQRIGIGTESPEARLHVDFNSSVADPQLRLFEVDNDYARLTFSNNQTAKFWSISGYNNTSSASERLNFYHSTTGDVLSITGTGNVGIFNLNPTARLHLNQAGQAVGTGLRFTDGTANSDWDITHGFSLRFHYGGALRGFINATTGAYTQSSDARLKRDVEEMETVLSRVNRLRALRYRYNDMPENTQTLGFIAQEVAPVFPELVAYSEADDLYGIDYAGFSVIAIKAIQEQQLVIEQQQAALEALQRRLAEQEQAIARLQRN